MNTREKNRSGVSISQSNSSVNEMSASDSQQQEKYSIKEDGSANHTISEILHVIRVKISDLQELYIKSPDLVLLLINLVFKDNIPKIEERKKLGPALVERLGLRNIEIEGNGKLIVRHAEQATILELSDNESPDYSHLENTIYKLIDRINNLLDGSRAEVNKKSNYTGKMLGSDFSGKGKEQQAIALVRHYVEKAVCTSLPNNINRSPEFFVERNDCFKLILEKINLKKKVILSGLAGSGKTELACCYGRYFESTHKKHRTIINMFTFDQETTLIEQYRTFLKSLKLTNIEENFIDQLYENDAFELIKEGLDLEYPDADILFIFDNVDDSASIELLKKILADRWFEERGCYVVITSQDVELYESTKLPYVSLQDGLKLKESLELLIDKKNIDYKKITEYLKYLESENINLNSVADQLLEVIARLECIYETSGKNRETTKEIILYLKLISLFDALPLGLLIARQFLADNPDINYLLNKVTKENIATIEYIDKFCDQKTREYYGKKKGACSQVSAIRLMIRNLDKNDFMDFKSLTGLSPSDVLQVLSLCGSNNIPSIIIEEILPKDKDEDYYLLDRFFHVFNASSLRRTSEQREYFVSNTSNDVKKIFLISVHGQTQFASRTLLLESDVRKQRIIQTINAINTLCNSPFILNDSRNLWLKNIMGEHLFNLINYIGKHPKYKYDFPQIMSEYKNILLKYLDTIYDPEWAVSLLNKFEEVTLASDDKGNAANKLFQINLLENVMRSHHEKGIGNVPEKYMNSVTTIFKSMSISVNTVWDANKIDMALSVINIFQYSNGNYIDILRIIPAEKLNNAQKKKYELLLINDAHINKNTEISFYSLMDNMGNNPSDSFHMSIIDFRFANYLLHHGKCRDAIDIYKKLVSKPHCNAFHYDIHIALSVCYISSAKYDELFELFRDDNRHINSQISYLMCLAYLLMHRDGLQNKDSSISNVNATSNNLEKYFDIIWKKSSIIYNEFYLIFAYYNYHFLQDLNKAEEACEKYFLLTEGKKNNSPVMQKFNSQLSRRLFYFCYQDMERVTGNHLLKSMQGYKLYTEILNKNKKYEKAGEYYVKHINKLKDHNKSDVHIILSEIYNMYKKLPDITNCFKKFIEITDKIDLQFKDYAFYKLRAYIGYQFPPNISQKNVIAEFSSCIRLSKTSKENNSELYAYKACVHMKDNDYKMALESINLADKYNNKKENKNIFIEVLTFCANQLTIEDFYHADVIACYTSILQYDALHIDALFYISKHHLNKRVLDLALDYSLKIFDIFKKNYQRDEKCRTRLLDCLDLGIKTSHEDCNAKTEFKFLSIKLELESLANNFNRKIIDLLFNLLLNDRELASEKNIYSELLCKSIDTDSLPIQPLNSEVTIDIDFDIERYCQYAKCLKSSGLVDEAVMAINFYLKFRKDNQSAKIMLANLQCSRSEYFFAFELMHNEKFDKISPKDKKEISAIFCEIASNIKMEEFKNEYDKNIIRISYEKASNLSPDNKEIKEKYHAYLKSVDDNEANLSAYRKDFNNATGWIYSPEKDLRENFLRALKESIKGCKDEDKISKYEEILFHDPGNEEIMLDFSCLYYNRGEYQKLIDRFLNCVKTDKELAFYVGLSYFRLGSYDKAKEYLAMTPKGALHYPSQYFLARTELIMSQCYRVNYSDDVRSDSISKAIDTLKRLYSIVSKSKINQPPFLDKFKKKYIKFYCLYSIFIQTYCYQYTINQINNTDESIKELTEDLDSFIKDLQQNKQRLFKNNNNSPDNSVFFDNVYELKNCLKKFTVNFKNSSSQEISIHNRILLEKEIEVALKKHYSHSGYVFNSSEDLTSKFIIYWKYLSHNFYDDPFFIDRLMKYKLIIKWYISNKGEGKLLNFLKEQENVLKVIRDMDSIIIEKHEEAIETAIISYGALKSTSSTLTSTFIDNFYKIKFGALESSKPEKYKELLLKFLKDARKGTTFRNLLVKHTGKLECFDEPHGKITCGSESFVFI